MTAKRTAKQLGLDDAKATAGRSAPLRAPDANPVAMLEGLHRDIGNALKIFRGIVNLDKDRAANSDRIAAQIPKARSAIAKLPAAISKDVEGWLTGIEQAISEDRTRRSKSFPADLDRALKEVGLKLEGHVPTLKSSFFTIIVEGDRIELWYGPERERLERLPASGAAVASTIKATLDRLNAEPLEAERFIELLHRCYRAVVADHNGPGVAQHQARLDDVHRQMIMRRQERGFTQAQRFRPYTRTQFSYDLYRLKGQVRWRNLELHLVTASRSQTSNKQDSLWVPSDESGRGSLYSHIVFREVS